MSDKLKLRSKILKPLQNPRLQWSQMRNLLRSAAKAYLTYLMGCAAALANLRFSTHRSEILKRFLVLCLLTYSASCSTFNFKEDPKMNTEIICPNGAAILVKFVRARELGNAIRTAYLNKKRLRTSEGYTPVRLKDGRSFVLKNISPEVAATCDLRESRIGAVEASYIHHF